jgi:hypothetical protein
MKYPPSTGFKIIHIHQAGNSFAFAWILVPDTGTPVECICLNQVSTASSTLLQSPNWSLFLLGHMAYREISGSHDDKYEDESSVIYSHVVS